MTKLRRASRPNGRQVDRAGPWQLRLLLGILCCSAALAAWGGDWPLTPARQGVVGGGLLLALLSIVRAYAVICCGLVGFGALGVHASIEDWEPFAPVPALAAFALLWIIVRTLRASRGHETGPLRALAWTLGLFGIWLVLYLLSESGLLGLSVSVGLVALGLRVVVLDVAGLMSRAP